MTTTPTAPAPRDTDAYWAWIDTLTPAELDAHHRSIHPRFEGDPDTCADCEDENR